MGITKRIFVTWYYLKNVMLPVREENKNEELDKINDSA